MIFHRKTQPVPEHVQSCLNHEKSKKNGKCNCTEVLEQLQKDFKNKCYICEDKEPHSLNVEHFKPISRYRELEFDWDNLFFSCSHCNNIKSDKPQYDSILNCTIESDGVDTKIRYHIEPFPKKQAEIESKEDTEKVNNTVCLLREVYNGTTIQKKMESANLRSQLLNEIRRFQDLLFQFYDNSNSPEEKEETKKQIVRELKPASCFTAFKRWIVRESPDMMEDFAEYLE